MKYALSEAQIIMLKSEIQIELIKLKGSNADSNYIQGFAAGMIQAFVNRDTVSKELAAEILEDVLDSI